LALHQDGDLTLRRQEVLRQGQGGQGPLRCVVLQALLLHRANRWQDPRQLRSLHSQGQVHDQAEAGSGGEEGRGRGGRGGE